MISVISTNSVVNLTSPLGLNGYSFVTRKSKSLSSKKCNLGNIFKYFANTDNYLCISFLRNAINVAVHQCMKSKI